MGWGQLLLGISGGGKADGMSHVPHNMSFQKVICPHGCHTSRHTPQVTRHTAHVARHISPQSHVSRQASLIANQTTHVTKKGARRKGLSAKRKAQGVKHKSKERFQPLLASRTLLGFIDQLPDTHAAAVYNIMPPRTHAPHTRAFLRSRLHSCCVSRVQWFKQAFAR